MKLPHLRSTIFPVNGRRWDVVVASVFLVATTASLVSAKTLAFTGAIFIAVLGATQAWRGELSRSFLRPSLNTILLAAFFSYAALTALWSQDSAGSLIKLATIVMFALAVLFAVRTIESQSPSSNARLGESLWIGLILGMLYLIARNLTRGYTDGAMLPPIARQFVKFDLDEMTRSIAPVTLLIGPALLAISAGFRKPSASIFSAMLVCIAVLAIATSPHETSKLALVAWFALFGLASLSERTAFRLLQTGWLAACLLVVPTAILSKDYNIQNAQWLQPTAQYRILIWNTFAELSLQRPIFGYGFNAAALSRPEIPGLNELYYQQKGKPVPAKVIPFQAVHPHNAYLQVWYELGAVGVGLFLAVGLALLSGLSQLQPHQRPYMYAAAAASMVMLFSSYGLWQLWLVGLLSFAAISSAIAIKLSTASETAETSV